MSMGRSLGLAGAVALLSASFGGCVSTAGEDGARLTDNFQVYAPFDNERDWGPSYLVGPKSQLTGQAAGPGAADPAGPPLSDQPAQLAPQLP